MSIIVFLAATAIGTEDARAASAEARADRALDRALRKLVAQPDGPPGAIAVIQRPDERRVHRAGVADLQTDARLRAGKHVRIASVSKAFSGAAALALVDEGVLAPDDTIGQRLPGLPVAWHPVTLGQLLNHTSGLPDFTASGEFAEAVGSSPQSAPAPRDLLGFVEDEPLNFAPGSDYRYSNSDNIAVGLMIEAVTGAPYEHVLRTKVLRPAGLGESEMAGGIVLPNPFIRGYSGETPPEDVSQLVAFGGWAWAAGGITSTPGDLNRFVRAYVGGELFGPGTGTRQREFVEGAASEPRGPGKNSAGLGLFRYRTRCGKVFGHTGSILGYTQLVAATANGRRSLTFTITNQISDELLPQLRKAQTQAVCTALAR